MLTIQLMPTMNTERRYCPNTGLACLASLSPRRRATLASRAVLLLVGVLLVAAGCDQRATSTEAAQQSMDVAAADRPASYLDEAPAPPTSDTFILSGGTLVGDTDQFDAVVVVQDQRVIAAGKRGEVPVPPDSIGIDTSGKFILADDLDVTLIGGPANLTVFDEHPSKVERASVHAKVINGVWQLEGEDANSS